MSSDEKCKSTQEFMDKSIVVRIENITTKRMSSIAEETIVRSHYNTLKKNCEQVAAHNLFNIGMTVISMEWKPGDHLFGEQILYVTFGKMAQS